MENETPAAGLEAVANMERALLEPVVEGELVIRAEGMLAAIDRMRETFPEVCGAAVTRDESALDALNDDSQRLAIQLEELRLAARRLRERAAAVEPDEKQVQHEVDTLVEQGRQWTVGFRQFEEARLRQSRSAPQGNSAP